MERLAEEGVSTSDSDEIFRYLGRRVCPEGVESCKMVWEFKWVVERLNNKVEGIFC